MEKILFLAHPGPDGEAPRVALEALCAALQLRDALGAELSLGLLGSDVERTAGAMAGCGATSGFAVRHEELGVSRYGTDVAALAALVGASAPTLIVAPGTSRFSRALPGLAVRIGGKIETHVTGLDAAGGGVTAERWYYRQRIRTRLRRADRPWIILVDSGAFPEWRGEGGPVALREVGGWVGDAPGARITRTRVLGEESGESSARTIRPEAEVLLVAGAGWTKKQADGRTHPDRAEELILGFLSGAQASLGSSKSLVDQSAEGQAVLSCLSHLNQVGQTGSTPRHPKGLATCCHGEEPHVVGWRFIQERRAVNLDANCGWARGKADVVYVADAFQVMEKVNQLLSE